MPSDTQQAPRRRRLRLLAGLYAAVSVAAAGASLLIAPGALLQGNVAVLVGLLLVGAAGVPAVLAATRSSRRWFGWAAVAHALAAFLFVANDAYVPALAATALFLAGVALRGRASRMAVGRKP